MQQGEVPIYEPHLDVLFERNIKANRLQFTTSLDEGLAHGDIIFLALPTPEDEDGSADLSYVLNVSQEIGKKIGSYKVIVDKSIGPPLLCRNYMLPLCAREIPLLSWMKNRQNLLNTLPIHFLPLRLRL